MVRKLAFAIFTACAALLSGESAEAREIYVAKTGTETGAGTSANPLLRIQAAIDIAQAGDTILVRAGTYRETPRFSRSGSQGAPITLKRYANDAVIVDLQGNYNTPGRQILLQNSQGEIVPIEWITIEGLEILSGYVGIKMYNAYNVIIRNNFIHESASQGILGNGYKTIFDRNVIARTGYTGAPSTSNQYHGIYFTGTEITFTNNVVHSNLGYGLQVAAYPLGVVSQANDNFSNAKRWLISNNVFANQQNRGGMNFYLPGATDNLVQNNIFYDNSQAYSDGANGVSLVSSGPRNVLKNNLYFSPRGRIRIDTNGDSQSVTESGALTADPQFTSPSVFAPRSTSPAIDRGITDSRVPQDIQGVNRPGGSAHDIGAYEYVTNSAPHAPSGLVVGP